LFLAGKAEETSNKLKDIILVCYKWKNRDQDTISRDELELLRKTILNHEFIVLKALRFDLTVEHPYKHLLFIVKSLEGNIHLAQVAWNFLNDSYRTLLCLQFKPKIIACGVVHMACTFLKFKVPQEGNKAWWKFFGATREDIEEISNQILDLYEFSPQVEAMQSNLLIEEQPKHKHADTNMNVVGSSPRVSATQHHQGSSSSSSKGDTSTKTSPPSVLRSSETPVSSQRSVGSSTNSPSRNKLDTPSTAARSPPNRSSRYYYSRSPSRSPPNRGRSSRLSSPPEHITTPRKEKRERRERRSKSPPRGDRESPSSRRRHSRSPKERSLSPRRRHGKRSPRSRSPSPADRKESSTRSPKRGSDRRKKRRSSSRGPSSHRRDYKKHRVT